MFHSKRLVLEGGDVPTEIVVSVKRFSYDPGVNGTLRSHVHVIADCIDVEFTKWAGDVPDEEQSVTTRRYVPAALMYHLPSQRGANAGHYITLAAEDDGWVRYDDDAVTWERGEPQALSNAGCALTFAIRYTLEPETV